MRGFVTFTVLSSVLFFIAACAPSKSYDEEYNQKRLNGLPLAVVGSFTSRPNSAGGVDAYLNIVNLSKKTIKYMRYTVVPYNAVGDRVSGTIRRRSAAKIFETGPIAPGKTTSGGWENVWYNYSIECMVISRLRIEYMDGTSKTFSSQSSINSLLRSDVSNSCRA